MTYRRPPGTLPPYQEIHVVDDPVTEPSRGRPPPKPRPSPVLVGFVYGGLGLLALAVGAITFFVASPPTDLIRQEIISQVKAATGRDLAIAGPTSFTIFPSIGVRVGDVSLSAPPGMGGEPLLTASKFDVGVRLLPLLRQEILVDRLVLHQPVFTLRVDAQGRKSWDMAVREAPRPVRLAQASPNDDTVTDFSSGASNQARASARLSDISELSLGDIRIVEGTVHYSDERTKSAYDVEAINLKADLDSIARPFSAKGSFVWAREKIDFTSTLTSPRDLLEERPAKLALNVIGKPLTMSYDGSVVLRDTVSAEGAVDGMAGSLRALAQWLGTDLPDARGFGATSFAGSLRVTDTVMRLTDAKLTLDGATATGTVAVTTAGARPHVTADLKVAGLDLGNYVAHGSAAPSGAAPAPPPPVPPAAAPEKREPKTIEDLLERPSPQVKGFTQRAGWSDEPLDLASLDLFDADAKLSVERLSYDRIRMESSNLTVALKDRVLKTTFEEMKLYQGRGNGFVTLDGTGKEASLATNFALSGIAAQPLLKDAAGIDWLAGTGNVTLAFSGRGTSQAAIVQALNGKATIAVTNGAIIGFNLGGAMRALSEGNIPEFGTSPSEKTDFSELNGSFLVTNGVAKNDDLKLASPLLRATGSGTVDLPARSLDYTLRPKLVASLEGQGGAQGLAGVEIPVHITGPWEAPAVSPDLAGVINNPEAVEAVKEIGKELKGKNAGEVIEDLFGKGKDGEPSKAEKLLDKFLGK